MKKGRFSRRDFIYLSVGGGLVAAGYPLARVLSQSKGARVQQPAVDKQQAFQPTPSNTLGPFYKEGAPRRERLVEAGETGTPLLVAGRVFDTEGRALSNAKVEVFHANAHGDYDMQGYRWRGEIPVSSDGSYRFESIIPGQYGGRAQHVHYMITAPGNKRLVTQLYFENDPKFAGDPDKNFSKDSLVWHRQLIRPVASVNRQNVTYSSVTFDICLEKA